MPLLLRFVSAILFAAVTTAAVENSSFREFDRDRDGRLSRWEVAQVPLDFDRLDGDGNGYLSRNEMRRAVTGNRSVPESARTETPTSQRARNTENHEP